MGSTDDTQILWPVDMLTQGIYHWCIYCVQECAPVCPVANQNTRIRYCHGKTPPQRHKSAMKWVYYYICCGVILNKETGE